MAGTDSIIMLPTREYLEKALGGKDRLFPFLELYCLDTKFWKDDFDGDLMYGGTAPGLYTVMQNASGTFTIVSNAENGAAVLSTVGTTTNDYAGVYLDNKAKKGANNPVIAVRLHINTAITSTKVEVGFTDSAATSAGVVNALATPTFNATDGVVWVYDTSDTALWQCAGVDGGAAATKIEPSYFGEATAAPVADTYQTLVVALRKTALTGDICSAKFVALDQYGQKIYESGWMDDACSSNVQLYPWVFVQTRADAAKTIDVDYIATWQRRTAT